MNSAFVCSGGRDVGSFFFFCFRLVVAAGRAGGGINIALADFAASAVTRAALAARATAKKWPGDAPTAAPAPGVDTTDSIDKFTPAAADPGVLPATLCGVLPVPILLNDVSSPPGVEIGVLLSAAALAPAVATAYVDGVAGARSVVNNRNMERGVAPSGTAAAAAVVGTVTVLLPLPPPPANGGATGAAALRGSAVPREIALAREATMFWGAICQGCGRYNII